MKGSYKGIRGHKSSVIKSVLCLQGHLFEFGTYKHDSLTPTNNAIWKALRDYLIWWQHHRPVMIHLLTCSHNIKRVFMVSRHIGILETSGMTLGFSYLCKVVTLHFIG